MRSRSICSISAAEVHSWALQWLAPANLIPDHGPVCTAVAVLSVVLRAAARCISLTAACRDLAKAPSDQGLWNALDDGLPKTLRVLERRLNDALTHDLPRRLKRRAWEIAIDWHLSPYYGQPYESRNELYYGKPRQGTSKFHAYASACIVVYGQRYTVALTWVRRHETAVTALERLFARIDQLGLKIRRVLLDRAFFNLPVIACLQQRRLPFLMPVMIRGRRPKKRRPATGLRWIQRQPAGWYRHELKNKSRSATVSICVNYRTYRKGKARRKATQKLLFAAWRVTGSPTVIREAYRLRFGIETSFRQMRQARIYTCTRKPHLRLFFVAIALILRNVWVWLHATILGEGSGDSLTVRLERLRFKRMLDWIDKQVVALYHDGSLPSVDWDP